MQQRQSSAPKHEVPTRIKVTSPKQKPLKVVSPRVNWYKLRTLKAKSRRNSEDFDIQVIAQVAVNRIDHQNGKKYPRSFAIELIPGIENVRPTKRRLRISRAAFNIGGRDYFIDLNSENSKLYSDVQDISLLIEDKNNVFDKVKTDRRYKFLSKEDYDEFMTKLNDNTTTLQPIESRPGLFSFSELQRVNTKMFAVREPALSENEDEKDDGKGDDDEDFEPGSPKFDPRYSLEKIAKQRNLSPATHTRLLLAGQEFNIFLIRHGESYNNVLGKKNIVRWQIDSELSDPKGWEQCNELGQKLRDSDFLKTENIGQIYCSPLRRAMQSAFQTFVGTDEYGDIIKENVATIPNEKIIVHPVFSEVRTSIGDCGHLFVELERMYTLRQTTSILDLSTHRKEGQWWPERGNTHMEPQSKQEYRIRAFADWLKHEIITKQQNVCLVGHSHFFLFFEKLVLSHHNPNNEKIESLTKLDNCSMLKLTYNPARDLFENCILYLGGRVNP